MAALRLRNITVSFNTHTILKSIDLTINSGELMVLLGPSGCGKTTLLRCIAGLEMIEDGEICIDTANITGLTPAARNISMVFQNNSLFSHMTVAENIGIGLNIRGYSHKEINVYAREAARLTSCIHLMDRYPTQLSGGEQQRVALARAITRKPDVFLLDEPLSSLDAQLRVQMRAELRLLQQTLGSTMIYVTHDQTEALAMGDRIAVLYDGCIQQTGTPAEVYTHPVNAFVASFIGSPAMNMIPVRVEHGKLDTQLVDYTPLQGKYTQVVLGVRPEHIHIQRKGKGVPATITLVEMTGSESIVHLHLERTNLVAKVPSDTRFKRDETVYLTIPSSKIYLFTIDGQTIHPIYGS